MPSFKIRTIGDPVLTRPAREVTEIDGALAQLAEGMFEALHDADAGIGLAAPQVGVQKRLFVHDLNDEPIVVINPEIKERRGEVITQEGCLSIPGLWFDVARAEEVFVVAYDLDGNELEIEAEGLEARLYQHEIDHLDGVLMVSHLDEEQARLARQALRELQLSIPVPTAAQGLQLP